MKDPMPRVVWMCGQESSREAIQEKVLRKICIDS